MHCGRDYLKAKETKEIKDAKEVPTELEDSGQATLDELLEIDMSE